MKRIIHADRLVIVLAAIFLVFLCFSAGIGTILILQSFPKTAGLRLPGVPEKRGLARSSAEKPYRVRLPVVMNRTDQSFSFITWADTKSGIEMLGQLSNQAADYGPAFTLFSGDLEENGFTSEGIAGWVNAVGGGRANGLAEITFTVRGNHDVQNPQGWQDFFALRKRAVDLGMTHFSSLIPI